MTPPLEEWARAYLATQLIEVPIAVGWLRSTIPVRDALGIALLASTLTHPLLWYAWPHFDPPWLNLALGEAVVWTVEAMLYGAWLRRFGAPRPFATGLGVSCLANGASLFAGLLLW